MWYTLCGGGSFSTDASNANGASMEKKNTTKKAAAPARRKPRLVTKDTNDSGVKNTVVDPLSVIESAPPVIDSSVFDDDAEDKEIGRAHV